MMQTHKILVVEDMDFRIKVFKHLSPPHDLTIIQDAEPAIAFLKEHGPVIDVVFLDHDLGGREYVPSEDKNTGAEVARFMKSNDCTLRRSTPIIVHSLNPGGAENILNELHDHYEYLHRIPYYQVKTLILTGTLFPNDDDAD